MPELTPIPFRIRIGITGPTTLVNEGALRDSIQGILEEEIGKLFDPNRPAPTKEQIKFEAVTALADGADQVVAEGIRTVDGSTIAAVLPLQESDYRATISADRIPRFEVLLNADREPHRMRRLTLEQEFPALSEQDLKRKREAAYDNASRYIVDHCDVLIAIWDPANDARRPNEDRQPGDGAIRAVEHARKRNRPIIFVDPTPPPGKSGEKIELKVRVEKGSGLDARAFPSLERFNAASADPARERAQCDLVSDQILGTNSTPEIQRAASHLPPSAKDAIKILIPEYVRAERIAHKNQWLFQLAGLLIYVLAALSVVLVAIGVFFANRKSLDHYHLPHLMFVSEFCCLVGILIIFWWSRSSNAHHKWIESRFLAERFRSAFYLAACGIEASPVEVPAYLGVSHRPDDWMVRAFEETWRRLPRLPRCIGPDCTPFKDFIRESWIKGQVLHHDRKAAVCAHKEHKLERWGLTFFGGALAAALLHSLGFPESLAARLEHLAEYMPRVGGTLHRVFLQFEPYSALMNDLLTAVAIAFPAIGAALFGIRTNREYDRLAKRSSQMAAALRDLDTRIGEAREPDELEALVRETEELMLRETQEWLMLMRFVKVEPP